MTDKTEIEARPSFGSDELTEAEKAYFNSGGQDVSGLLKEDIYKAEIEPRREELQSALAQPSPTPTPQPVETSPAPVVTQTTTPPVTEEVVGENEDFSFDGLKVGPDGRLRDDKGRYVPLTALQRERERFKGVRDENHALRDEHAKLQENYSKLAGRIEALQELWQKPPAAEPVKEEIKPEPVKEEVPPDPEQDIFAYVRYQQGVIAKQNEALQNLAKRFEEIPAKVDATQKAVQEQFTERDVISYYRSDASQFAQENPAFTAAYRDLITKRHAALALLGYADPKERAAQIQKEERELVNMAVQQNRRPAEFLYNYAVANGFAPAAPQPNPTPAPAAAPPAPMAQPTPAPAAPPAGQMTNADRLQAAVAAQAATATLSGAGGVATETLSVESLASMSDAEFAAIYSKLGKAGMRQYLGGGV